VISNHEGSNASHLCLYRYPSFPLIDLVSSLPMEDKAVILEIENYLDGLKSRIQSSDEVSQIELCVGAGSLIDEHADNGDSPFDGAVPKLQNPVLPTQYIGAGDCRGDNSPVRGSASMRAGSDLTASYLRLSGQQAVPIRNKTSDLRDNSSRHRGGPLQLRFWEAPGQKIKEAR
jgi:hypothetical protein